MENATLIFSAQGWVSLQKEKASAELLDDIEVLENYLALARRQGWIDAVNFLIIAKEYRVIKSGVKPPQGLIRQSLEMSYSLAPGDIKKITASPSLNKLESPGKETSPSQLALASQDLIKQEALSRKALARQEKILEILGGGEKAQVADFIKQLPDITKRTVRRDLDDLLKKGKIIRVGEWNQVFYQLIDRTNSINRKMS